MATRLLEKKLYAGQDQLMLALALLDGQTPGQLSAELGVPSADHHQDDFAPAGARVSRQARLGERRAPGAHFSDPRRARSDHDDREIGEEDRKKALDGLDKKDRKTLYKLLKKIEGNLSLEDKDDSDEAEDADADDVEEIKPAD